MKKSDIDQLKKLIYFDKQTLRNLFVNEKEKSISENILRWIRTGELVLLKRGTYTTKYWMDYFRGDQNFRFFISNSLWYPSYISNSTALQYYGVLTEATYNYTAVTLKRGESYINKLGTFKYSSIKKELFTGYTTVPFINLDPTTKGNTILIATKAKALFDFIYYKSKSIHSYGKNTDLVEELRLNMFVFTEADLKEFYSYTKICKNVKLSKIINNIIKNAKSSNNTNTITTSKGI